MHLANSMPVRYSNYLHLSAERRIKVFANRGTSGIDGCTSTAVGSALAHPDSLVVLFTGDMAFFYDRNALWHNYLPQNLRIVVFNNHGGGIFRMIDGPAKQPELDEYFETKQVLSAKNTATDFGLRYFKADNLESLAEAIPAFFGGNSAALLEVESDSAENARFLKELKEGFREFKG